MYVNIYYNSALALSFNGNIQYESEYPNIQLSANANYIPISIN